MRQIAFWVVIVSAVLDEASLIVSILRPDLRTWPPPGRNSWQFVCKGILSWTTLLGIAVLGVLDWNGSSFGATARGVGGLLVTLGGAFGLWGFLTLGVDASQGLAGDLVISGPYRYSRNPQYVGTIPVLIGYGLLTGSALTLAAAALASGWFVLAPFAEEPWLGDRLGAAYADYVKRVRRFV